MKNVTPLQCRACGKSNDAHTCAAALPYVPHDGDLSLCAYCGTWSVFERGGLRAPTLPELAAINTNPQCIRAERVRDEVMRERS